MIELFVKRPAMTIILVTFFVVLGIVSYSNLFVELMPKIDFPLVTVKVEYPGATPFEVETQVVKKIEDVVSELSEIKKLYSRSYESYGFVIIEFNLGVNANIKSIEAKDKIEAILNDLPKNAKKPLVERFDPFATPVVELVLSSDKFDARTLYEYADKKLKNRLSIIKGVATVNLYGGKKRQINVKIDPVLAGRYFTTITDVISTIAQKNLNVPGGVIDKDENSVSIRFVGEFSDVEALKKMEIVSREGNKIKLSDIATVEDGFKKIDSIARFNGSEAVGLSLKKVTDGNAVEIGKSITKSVPEIQKTLPEGMKLTIASDTTKYIVQETKNTISSIIIGILLTVLVMYLFTGKFKITFIASVVIPSSIISSIFLVDKSNFTINFVTLLATATALGTLIANAIVIIDSILAHLKMGKDPVTASIDGTKEVVVAVLASAGTNIVVFTPIAFMGGIVGQFMRQFGLTVVYQTFFSILASFTLTPMMCAWILKEKVKKDNKENIMKKFAKPFLFLANRLEGWMLAEYKIIFNWLFRLPKTALFIQIGLLFCSFLLMKYVGNEFMGNSDQDKILAKVVLPQGSTIDKTLEASKEIEDIFKSIPEKTNYLTSIGENGLENATLSLDLIPASERKASDLNIIEKVIPKLAEIPDAEINLIRGEQAGGQEGDITINVYGMDYDKMIEYSKEIKNKMALSGYFRSVISSYKNPKDEIQFFPNQDEMALQGVPYVVAASTIRASIYGDDSNLYREKGEEYDINVEMATNYKNSDQDINQISVISNKGLLPVTALGELKTSKALPTIWRRDKERVIQLDGLLSKSSAGQVQSELDKTINRDIKFEKGYGYRYAGNSEFQEETNREIAKAFVLAAILTYMLLVAMLNSYLHPFTIATSIFTSLMGVILLLFFTESTVSIASLLTVVMLVGLVVNNAILMLDATMRKMRDDKDVGLIDAIWWGVEDKFKAILMTSICIIFGTLPQLWSNDVAKLSMGAVFIGGMIGSIIFTFTFIPVVFWYFERMKNYFTGKRSIAG